jgi:glucose-1-phosphate thymidylyltransferase
MKCVILCAGYATRLHPLTIDKPKALLPIKGKPILDYIIKSVPNEIDKIFIVSNDKFYNNFVWWLQSQNSFFKDKVEIVNDGTVSNENRLGGIGCLFKVIQEENIKDDVLVILGDNLFSFRLDEFVEFFEDVQKTLLGVIKIDKNKAKDFGVVEVDKDKIVSFEEKPQIPKSDLISTGIYMFTKDDLEKINWYMKTDLSKEGPGYLIQYLLDFQDVYSYQFRGEWYDIGDKKTYEELNLQGI